MLTTRLKDDNWALHQIAERQETPGSLIKGTMPKDGYLGMLKQQLLVNQVLDRVLQLAIKSEPTIAELVIEEQLLTQYIVEDLHHFQIDADTIEATVGTQRFIDHIESHANQPLHLLGLHYVRLGACNGNTFVARVVRKAYGLEDQNLGTRYLDPFGKSQRSKWMEFKAALDAMPFDDAQRDAVFDGTRSAYLYAINMDLPEFKDAETLLNEHGKTLDHKAFVDGHSVHVETPHSN
jgi:heme oxygenase